MNNLVRDYVNLYFFPIQITIYYEHFVKKVTLHTAMLYKLKILQSTAINCLGSSKGPLREPVGSHGEIYMYMCPWEPN